MIKGNVTGNVNIRSTPDASGTGNIVGVIFANQSFTGSEYVKDTLGKNWIKLLTVNGIQTSGYIAGYITTVVIDEVITDPLPEVGLGIPEKVTTIEEFKLQDGTIKKRIIEWTNPTVLEG
jgi:hypothetical protein